MNRKELVYKLEDIYLEGYHCGCRGDFTEWLEAYYPKLMRLAND